MPNPITLAGELLTPARNALYSRLTAGTDALYDVLWQPERERSPAAHDAYRGLCATGALLDRLGWREQDSKDTLTLTSEGEARLLIDALEVELEIENGLVESGSRLGGPETVLAAVQRSKDVEAALAAVRAAAASAGLLDAGRS